MEGLKKWHWEDSPMDKKIALRAENLTFSYDKKTIVVHQQNLSLYQGETVILTGPNGSGKTTLGKLLTGILKPTNGTIRIFDQDSKDLSLGDIGRKIGYCFQNPGKQLFAASVEEEIRFGLKYRGEDIDTIDQVTQEMMDIFEISHLKNEFPFNLSWGEKRRVVLAATLALNPAYLILDEPTTGLDEGRIDCLNRILKNLREKGIGMLLISHNQSFIDDNAYRILRMERGCITDDFYR